MASSCRTNPARLVLLAAGAAVLGGCAVLPRELNLSPLWFHRLDADGEVLEWDCLWPLLHYERTTDGGDDFRIRPLYRRVTEPPQAAVEHQFLWPLGRVRSDAEESMQRLFPLWSHRSRINDEGERDVDWYALFPLFWGGSSADQRENYFAFFPFYADVPQFLTYDRAVAILFPLYLRLDKGGHRHQLFLWPLIGIGSCAENDHRWFRVLPFYGHDIEPGRHDRRFVLWPFFAWSTENEFSDAPVQSFWLWPLFGWRSGRTVHGWMVLWPFFQHTWKDDHFARLNLFWPLFFHYWNRAEDNVSQWWLFPLLGRVHSDDQRAWFFLWPLVWWREYHDPDLRTTQNWILPFYYRIVQDRHDVGERETFEKFWPFLHRTSRTDVRGAALSGDWSLLSPFPWRDGNAYGVEEAYGFLWQLAVGRQRAADDDAFDLVARLFTRRERQGGTTASVPFLGSYERAADGATVLRLLHCIPIRFGGNDGAPAPEPGS
ncbi:MAG: hypothetical protein KF830_01760 [Planctomycetes bacterium]|nr:hypothetical protein [Planctomycetota bacterium]